MNTTGAKTQSRFFTGHYSMSEVNSICKSEMGSIRITKNGYTRRGSLTCFQSLNNFQQEIVKMNTCHMQKFVH